MANATVTRKGQITIPAEYRKKLGLQPGTQMKIWTLDDGTLWLKRAASFRKLAGIFHVPGAKPVTTKDMDRAIMRSVAKDDKRIRDQYK